MIQSAGLRELYDIAGSEHVIYDAEFLRQHGWEGELPKACVTPSTEEQLCEIMRLAQAEKWKVAPAGNFTKVRLGGVTEGIDLVISLRCLNGIIEYQPADLTVTVEAGTRLSALNAALAKERQMLPLDVPFTATGATIGGVMATNSSGPRRLSYGSVRDMAIGARFVTADGTLAKSGGKVVKNVAGYDIVKLLIGSYGTLGIVTSATFKVFPLPPATATVVMGFATVVDAMKARDRILNSPLIPQSLDLVDAAAAELMGQGIATESAYSLLAAVAGPPLMVERVCRELPELVRFDGVRSVSELNGEAERTLWNAVQEITPLALERSRQTTVVKGSVVLSNVGNIVARARDAAAQHELQVATVARAGSGTVYCHIWPARDGDAPAERIANTCEIIVREAEQHGGWATIEWTTAEVKSRLPQWNVGDDFAVMQRVKHELDPEGVLNPGRLFGKI
ncbi:MAG: FAD-binding oxidoreductase [Acidobacteria bacterium]|nr:FAD-binding oxidoreductase [Acidobacteriota bacterium]